MGISSEYNGVRLRMNNCERYKEQQKWKFDNLHGGSGGKIQSVALKHYCLATKHDGVTDTDIGQFPYMWLCNEFSMDQTWNQVVVNKTNFVKGYHHLISHKQFSTAAVLYGY